MNIKQSATPDTLLYPRVKIMMIPGNFLDGNSTEGDH